MKITLIRHTSVNVPSGVCYGFSDVSLQPSFREEAERTKEQLEGKTFDKVYTSPLSRCTLLADFCGYPEAIRDERLKEMNFGDWEMKSWTEIGKDEMTAWFSDWANYPAKNGESYSSMKIRIDEFMNDLKASEAESVCLFAHGGVIRLIHVFAGICKLEDSFELPVEYGQVFELNI